MAESTISAGVMKLQAFIQRYEQNGAFEIIDGEMIPLSPTVLGHNDVADNLVWLLNNHIRPKELGRTYTEAPFVLTYSGAPCLGH